MLTHTFFNSSKSEKRWVNHITIKYTTDLGCHPIVFEVPQSLRDAKPQAYTPQSIGLGPYHHFRPELQQMESQKQSAVKAYLRLIDLKKLTDFVMELPLKLESIYQDSFQGVKIGQKFQSTILSYYDRYLDLNTETLKWVVVTDGIFLLDFLNQELKWKDQRLVADIMMLENQIPFYLLQDIRKALLHSFPDAVDIELKDECYRLCDQQSPLKLSALPERRKAAFKNHLLHLMYDLIVNNYRARQQIEEKGTERKTEEERGLSRVRILCPPISGVIQGAKNMLTNVATGIDQAKARGLQIPGIVGELSKFLNQAKKTSDLYGSSYKDNQPRMANKIDVPSVSQLHVIANIEFATTDDGIRNVFFCKKKDKLYLPEITLGETSEVVLRNLVAYEAASAKPGSILELAEYVDFMCGIIDSKIDVELLRKFHIIKGNLPNEEIVRIFNGINKSTQRPDEESAIQKTIKDLNQKFTDLRIVKAYKFIDKSVADFQRWIALLFPLLVLMLLALQSFCQIYGCSSRRLGYASVLAPSSFSIYSEATAAKLSMPRKLLG